ncbi:MAG: DUF72 domain-containing protein [Theionarchaea archaeon]|nr:DUF72 domain-containing protein [Theionarchaea archaeon]
MIRVGVRGFPVSHKELFEEFRLLEVQRTFYSPPMERTVERWRTEAPEGVEFTVKAWQVITHPSSSPTYRRTPREVGDPHHYGYFRPTKEVSDAFETTASLARLLKARIIVFQTPASFRQDSQAISNMREFFSSLPNDFTYVWESRGNWSPETIQSICEDLGIIDGVDPFRRKSTTEQKYFRLHGSPPGEKMYSYTYTDEDLEELKSSCSGNAYVLFNNISMVTDARRFHALIQ